MTRSELTLLTSRCRYKRWTWNIGRLESGFYVQAKFGAQTGRKWYVSSHAVESEVVRTLFLAVLQAEEHEARERFTFDGIAVFGPHIDINALKSVAEVEERRAEG